MNQSTKISLGVLIALLTGFYLLPTAIAFTRSRTNTLPIFAVNLLLGWSIVGWVWALVWSIMQDPKVYNTAKPKRHF